jgi:hypothetical protein
MPLCKLEQVEVNDSKSFTNKLFLFFVFNLLPSPTGTDDETHEYEYLNEWGPRFDKLANMYGPEREHTDLDGLN